MCFLFSGVLEIPIDLTKVDDLDSLTSEWLCSEVFSKLRSTKVSATSKSSATSSATDSHQRTAAAVPVCLECVEPRSESINYFLTRAQEPITNFLHWNTPLKLCYATSLELKKERANHNKAKVVPQITDFDFIKTLG